MWQQRSAERREARAVCALGGPREFKKKKGGGGGGGARAPKSNRTQRNHHQSAVCVLNTSFRASSPHFLTRARVLVRTAGRIFETLIRRKIKKRARVRALAWPAARAAQADGDEQPGDSIRNPAPRAERFRARIRGIGPRLQVAARAPAGVGVSRVRFFVCV